MREGIGAMNTVGWPDKVRDDLLLGSENNAEDHLLSFAEGGNDLLRASQQCSQRQHLRAFEPAISDGTKIVTIKFP
jgi:hypothetical protein